MQNQEYILQNTVVIIPAYEPSSSFITYAKELLEKEFSQLLVINDGSGEAFDPIFQEIAALPRCTLLSYGENHGKGYALKYAFSYAKEHYDENTVFVTADCDGQHLCKDVEHAAEEAYKTPNELILGARDFSLPFVPKRSRSGNVFTRKMYKFLYGLSLDDTQTGLRAFSYSLLDQLLAIHGDRFEYEMNMLVILHKKRRVIREIPIETVYNEEMEDGAKVSHYRPLRDSMRILAILFKNLGWYFVSSVGSAVLEMVAFYLITHYILTANFSSVALAMLVPTVSARIISSVFNYFFNFKIVFHGKKKRSVFRYYMLWTIQLGLSYAIACGWNAIFANLAISEATAALLITLCKGFCDLLIGIASYGVQRAYVFADPKKK